MVAMITGTNARRSSLAVIVSLLHSIPGHLFAEIRFEGVNDVAPRGRHSAALQSERIENRGGLFWIVMHITMAMNDIAYRSDFRLRGWSLHSKTKQEIAMTESYELSETELDNVSGGFWAAVAGGIALGVAANAVYDFMKSHQGISDSIDYIKNQQK
jgi:lactobin A/cerein 7B family class IIb bacteriocin